MTPPPDTVPTEALLAQSAWLHRLARRLVRDEAGAEDAVQETLVAALERERAGRVPGRAWLAAVLRNVARFGARSGARRSAREDAHARAGAGEHPAADELLLRLEAQRRLVEAVAGLEEPYRSTVALRYLEALAPREIARRQGVPVKTVKTRLERGLARLRERLDRAYGSRGAWCAALGGLGRAGAPAAALGTAALGGLAMGTAVKWAAAAAAVVLAGVAVERTRSDAREPVRPAAKGSAEEPREAAVLAPVDAAVADGRDGRVSVPAPAARIAPAVQSAVAAPGQAPAAGQPVLTGLVVDTAGLPISGAEVVLLADPAATPTERSFETEARALTSRDGVFELQGFAGTGRLHARAPGLATVVAPALAWRPPPAPPVAVLGPERNYGGRVVDEQGQGLGDVALMLLLRPGSEPPGVDARAWMCGPFVQTTSSADGSFRLPAAGFARGMTLIAFTPGYTQQKRDAHDHEFGMALPDADDLELVVHLERDPLADVLAGRVVDVAGRGVAGAFVAAQVPDASGLLPAYLAGTTGEDGAFRITAEGLSSATEVRAAAAGRLPASLAVEGLDAGARADLLLVLDGESLSIRGRAVGPDGAPVSGARVWSFDVVDFGAVEEREGEQRFFRNTSVERLLSGDAGEGLGATTGADGSFELRGLVERTYRLSVTDPRTLASARDLSVRAGRADVVLRLSSSESLYAVAGRVESFDGLPLPDVLVRASRIAPRSDLPREFRPALLSVETRTDPEGRFHFDALALEDVQLFVSRQEGPHLHVDLAEQPDVAALRIRVPAVRRLRVRPVTGAGDGFRLVDAEGEPLFMFVAFGGRRSAGLEQRLDVGFDGVVETDERAVALVLTREGKEVRRIPLDLRAGETLALDL